MKRLKAIIPVMAMLLTGCSTVTLQDRDTGFLLTRRSNAFAKSGLGGFEVSIKPDGTRTMKLKTYATESADTWAGVITSLAEAMKTAAEASAKSR